MAESGDAAMVSPGTVLAARYQIVEALGNPPGGPAETWKALDRTDGREVVVKCLRLSRVSLWKQLELFEREAAILKGIRVPGVPACTDSFRLGTESALMFVMVRQYMPGANLRDLVRGGWRPTEQEIMRIGAELARISCRIHALHPPVIHRDINPANVILAQDGAVSLVDFGSVQDAAEDPAGASTVVGTAGYAAFEQFVGRATPRSDLYSIAATLVFLLTGRNPADLPARGMKVDWRGAAAASAPLGRVLDSWLEPDQEMRSLDPGSAAAILAGGPGGSSAPPSQAAACAGDNAPPGPPTGTRLSFQGAAGSAEYRVPERARSSGLAGLAAFGVFWLGFVGLWTFAAVSMRAPLAFPLFSIPFWAAGLFMVFKALKGLVGRVTLRVDPAGLTVTHAFLLFSRSFTVPLQEAGPCAVEEGRDGRGLVSVPAGARVFRLGAALTDREREWLCASLNDSIRRLSP
jgi:eukaryotic-like serine/threonine-protein kinase